MQVNNSLNSMLQLEKKLEKSANELAKLNNTTSEDEKKHQYNSNKKELAQANDSVDKNVEDESVQQREIPIAYSVNSNGISVQNTAQQTILDIRA
ncbi:MAG: hypothetical protein U9R16_03595 [Campylobacterota bacterium]|nr:hypothetical protein [Campylobacterota bacterium]